MTSSKKVTILRDVRRVHAPVGIRCVLCKLFAGDGDSPPSGFEVKYNGDDVMPENPLRALTRREYICDDCIDAIRRIP